MFKTQEKSFQSSKFIMDRRTVLHRGFGLATGAILGCNLDAYAENTYPNRTIKIIVPYSAGTGSDAMARTIAQSIGEKTGQTIIVENKEGGGSLIGTMALVNAQPDGYTILIAANPLVILPSQYNKPPYDPTRDIIPISKFGSIPLVLAVSPSLGLNNMKELVAYAKTNPGKLSYGSSGSGTISQQEMELFKQVLGLDIPEIPYKSTAQAMTDLLGGILPILPVVIPLVDQHLQSGRAKALAIFDNRRSPLLPNIPAITEEVNISGYTPTPVWYGFVAPAKTPKDIIQTLNGYIQTALTTPEVKNRMTNLGAQPINVSNEQFMIDLKNEYEKAGQLSKKLGVFK